jgi:uncharacterized protein YhaN
MKLTCFPLPFPLKGAMKKELKLLQDSFDSKVKENARLSSLITEKNEKIRSLEKVIDLMKDKCDKIKAAQEKTIELEAELNEVRTTLGSLRAHLDNLEMKVTIDIPRDSFKYIAFSVSALASLVAIRKIF